VVYAGLDASLRHDTTALAAVQYDAKAQRVRLVAHKLFRPSGEDIDFSEVENTVVEFRQRFALQSVSYDPYQLEGLAQRLRAKGLNMVALDQTLGNLTDAATKLFELFRSRNIALYPDPDVREAVLNASAKEASNGRGYRLAKEKPSKKIDLCAALSFACLKTVKDGAERANNFANALQILPAMVAIKLNIPGANVDPVAQVEKLLELERARSRCNVCGEPIMERRYIGDAASGTRLEHLVCPRDRKPMK
jgi:phage terminase large subunit-like protein